MPVKDKFPTKSSGIRVGTRCFDAFWRFKPLESFEWRTCCFHARLRGARGILEENKPNSDERGRRSSHRTWQIWMRVDWSGLSGPPEQTQTLRPDWLLCSSKQTASTRPGVTHWLTLCSPFFALPLISHVRRGKLWLFFSDAGFFAQADLWPMPLHAN